MSTLEQVQEVLHPIATALKSDGYVLTPEMTVPGTVTLRIVALEGACEDCLVPKTIMIPMIDGLLRKGGVEATVADVIYPKNATH